MIIPVVNRSPGGGHCVFSGLLDGGLSPQFIVPPDLQIIQLPKEHGKGTHAQQQHHQQGPAANHLIGPAGRIAFSMGILGIACHRSSLSRAARRDIPN